MRGGDALAEGASELSPLSGRLGAQGEQPVGESTGTASTLLISRATSGIA